MLYNYIGLTRNWVLQYTLYTIVLAYLQLSLYHKKQLVSVPAAYFSPQAASPNLQIDGHSWLEINSLASDDGMCQHFLY